MKTHSKLQEDVLTELAWDPRVDASHVGVATQDGVVTLTGYVTNFAQRAATEEIVKRIAGVRAVANDLSVELPGTGRRTDTDLAESCLRALEWDVEVPHDQITVRLSEGRVTLEGTVNWQFQRAAAERAVRALVGVKDVINRIAIKPAVMASEIKNRVESALKRYAEVEARQVRVEASDDKVTLRGSVHSWGERHLAETAAWSAPGVRQVENDLVVKN